MPSLSCQDLFQEISFKVVHILSHARSDIIMLIKNRHFVSRLIVIPLIKIDLLFYISFDLSIYLIIRPNHIIKYYN